MALLSNSFRLMSYSKCSPTTPDRHADLVWALPFSLATTQGIIIIFFSSSYLDVSVQRVDFHIAMDNTPSVCWVVPFGNLRIYRLCAAPRSLSQLTTSFFASESLGIPHAPLFCLLRFLACFRMLCFLLFIVFSYPNMSMNCFSFRKLWRITESNR